MEGLNKSPEIQITDLLDTAAEGYAEAYTEYPEGDVPVEEIQRRATFLMTTLLELAAKYAVIALSGRDVDIPATKIGMAQYFLDRLKDASGGGMDYADSFLEYQDEVKH